MHQRLVSRAAIGTLVALPLIVTGFVTNATQVSSAAGRPDTQPTPAAAAAATSPMPPTSALPTSPTSPDTSIEQTTAQPSPVAQFGQPSASGRDPRTIIGKYRVVAYYGGPDGPALGVLGRGTPDQMAGQIEKAARAFAGFGKPVLPAMELIATVAQGSPGGAGLYSAAIPPAAVARYLAAAHRHHMLLILDFQPGRGEFLPQVKAMERFILDPSVSVALDPEWKLGPHDVPGAVIGSSAAASVNSVVRYVSALVLAHHLPDKLLLVHQFRLAMLPNRSAIRGASGVEMVLHADGFGTPSEKLATWHALQFPGRPWGTGFKLFLTEDRPMLTPAQVMAAVRPYPDLITYQ